MREAPSAFGVANPTRHANDVQQPREKAGMRYRRVGFLTTARTIITRNQTHNL